MPFARCKWAASWLLVLLTPGLVLSKPVQHSAFDQSNNRTEDTTSGGWCFAWRNMICGSDGISYWNECLLEKAKQATPGLEVEKPGACATLECEDCEDDKAYGRTEICGTNRQHFKSKCLFECHQDTYPLLTEGYYNCYEGHFPTKEETDRTTIETYDAITDEYISRLQDIIEDNSFQKINLQDFHSNFEFNDTKIQVIAKKGWMKDLSTIRKVPPMQFYAFSNTIARVKLTFELDVLELGYPKFVVTGPNIKIKGLLAIKAGKSKIELTAEVKAGDEDCPYLRAISLQLTEVTDVVLEMSPQLTLDVPHAYVDGLVKEKMVQVINDVLTPVVLPKLKHTGCLVPKAEEGEEKKCYGIFQLRICF